MQKLICLFLLSVILSFDLSAQDSLPARTKKPWLLDMGLDVKFKNIAGLYNYYYSGEYYAGAPYEWIMSTRRQHFSNLFENASFTSFQMAVTISRSRNWRFGLCYDFGYIDKVVDTTYTYGTTPVKDKADRLFSYLGISAIGQYNYYFVKDKNEGPFAFGSLALGSYQGNNELEGPGLQLFGQLRAGVALQVPKGWIFRIYFSDDLLWYRERSTSVIFNQPQKVNIFLNPVYAGFGVVKQFTLIPE